MSEAMDKAIRDYSRREDDTEETAGIDLMLVEHIEWFLEHLWHDASELPDLDAKIVTLCEGQCVSTTRRNYEHGMKKWNPEKWCYLEDIKPNP